VYTKFQPNRMKFAELLIFIILVSKLLVCVLAILELCRWNFQDLIHPWSVTSGSVEYICS